MTAPCTRTRAPWAEQTTPALGRHVRLMLATHAHLMQLLDDPHRFARTRRSRLACAGVMVLLCCAAGTAQAGEIACLSPTRDATLYGLPGSSFDNTADGQGPHLWTSVTNGGFTRRALLRFDLSEVPAGSTITQAELRLMQSRAFNGHDVSVHRLTAAWTVGPANGGNSGAGVAASAGDVTWLSRTHPATPWATPGGQFVAQASASTFVDSSVGVVPVRWTSTPALVADVQLWLADPAANHGWVLIGDETEGQKGKRFESQDNGVSGNRPCLRLVFEAPVADIPLPAWALSLMALGLIALGPWAPLTRVGFVRGSNALGGSTQRQTD
jgi:hypothetical protein